MLSVLRFTDSNYPFGIFKLFLWGIYLSADSIFQRWWFQLGFPLVAASSEATEPRVPVGHLDDKTMEYLTPEDPKPGRFYLLPKIHKENNPGRPIVSANGHPTEKILEFIDFHFRTFPMMTELPHAEKYGNNEQFKNL